MILPRARQHRGFSRQPSMAPSPPHSPARCRKAALQVTVPAGSLFAFEGAALARHGGKSYRASKASVVGFLLSTLAAATGECSGRDQPRSAGKRRLDVARTA